MSTERESPSSRPPTESPSGRPPTPPTAPRMGQTPRSRRRLATPPVMPGMPNSNEGVCEQTGSSPDSKTQPVVSRKPAPVLTAKHLTPANDAELSESWKRFEQRKLERKERRHSKRRSQTVSPMAGLLLRSTPEHRICARMASKLAQPADRFSYRNPAIADDSMPVSQQEVTVFRKWA